MLYGDFQTWLLDEEIERKIFRMWLRDSPDGTMADYVFLKEIIPVGTNEDNYLIGFCSLDTDYEDNMYPGIDYYFLSEIHLMRYPQDMEMLYDVEDEPMISYEQWKADEEIEE